MYTAFSTGCWSYDVFLPLANFREAQIVIEVWMVLLYYKKSYWHTVYRVWPRPGRTLIQRMRNVQQYDQAVIHGEPRVQYLQLMLVQCLEIMTVYMNLKVPTVPPFTEKVVALFFKRQIGILFFEKKGNHMKPYSCNIVVLQKTTLKFCFK